jgi:acyl-CoA synthetase (AMP-forming)/AMP-acid ligase II
LLGEVAREAARRFGDTAAFVAADGWSLSYADLDRISDEAAGGLRRRGIGEGDVIALVLSALPEYMVAYVASAKLGAITAGVNPRLSPPERQGVLKVAHPALVLATAELAPSEGRVEEVVPAGRPDDALVALRDDQGDARTVPDDPDRPVALVFTSGTTGEPKGALFANRQLSAVTRIDVGDVWGAGGKAVAGTALAHLGPMTKLPGNIRRGTTSFLTKRWRPDEALEMVARHRLTTVGGIPTQLAMMMRVEGFGDYDLSSVRGIVIGGGPATPALVREARERFKAPLSVRYSCTEAAIGVGTTFDDEEEDAEVSVGHPLAGVRLALLDHDDRPVPEGTVGSVCLSSAAVMTGYYRDEEATKAAFTADGAVRTGDLGWLDERGRLHLAGRSKEMYVRGGYNVYPIEVEAVLTEHPRIASVAVVSRPDPVMGEVGVAVVTLSGAGSVSLSELREFASPRLAAFKLPEDLRVVDQIPLTSMEKVDRRALAELVVPDDAPRGGAAAPGR